MARSPNSARREWQEWKVRAPEEESARNRRSEDNVRLSEKTEERSISTNRSVWIVLNFSYDEIILSQGEIRAINKFIFDWDELLWKPMKTAWLINCKLEKNEEWWGIGWDSSPGSSPTNIDFSSWRAHQVQSCRAKQLLITHNSGVDFCTISAVGIKSLECLYCQERKSI